MDLKYLFKEAKYYRGIRGLSRAIKKFLLSQTIFSKIVNTKLYNKLYAQKIKKKAKTIKPFILQIENTNICNAKCVMCPHTIMKRKKKIMKLNDFKKILNNIMKHYKIKRLVMSGFGEPFIDKELIDKIKYANQNYPCLEIEIYTNASLLNKEKTNELLKTKIEKITFSINGTEKNYKQIMNLDYQNTKENVLYFLQKKNQSKHPVLVNLSLMILKENKKDIQEFVKFWKSLGDSVRVYMPSDWAGTLNTEMIARPRFKNKRWPCFALWANITVDVDGNVIMCCRDYESAVKFGNLKKQNIEEIRNSKKYKELQQKQLNFNFSTPICSKCDNSFDSSLDWIC